MRNKSFKIFSIFTALLILFSVNFQTVCFAQKDYWTNEVNILSDKKAELSKLILECEKNGLSVEYEKIDLYLIEKFIGHLTEDIDKIETGGQNILDRISYTVDVLNSMCDELSASLNSYLDKTDIPKEIVYTDNERAFNIGYLTGSVSAELENFEKSGSNYSTLAISMRDIIKESGALSGFSVMKSSESEDVSYTRNLKSGNNYMLTISAQSVKTGEDYIYQNISLEPNTEYEFGGEITADVKYSGYIALRKTEATGGKIDITKTGTNTYTQTFITGASANNFQFRMGLNSSNLSDVSFDNVFVRKAGTTENLLINSDFEVTVTDYKTEYGSGGIDYEILDSYRQILKNAEEKNIKLGIMLNLHEYPVFLQERNSDCMQKFSTYIPYNITEDKVRSDIGVFVKAVSESVKDFKLLESICLLNEPEYDTRLNSVYYQNMWAEYLKLVHKNINDMNTSYGGASYASFSEVEMPLDETCGGVFYDWKCFNEDVLVDYMQFLRNCVKSVSNIPVCFKVMLSNGYTDIEGFVQRGNTALEKFAEVSDYFGCDAYATYTKNQPLLGKTMVYDLAYSIGNMPIINAEDHVISDWVNYQDTEKCFNSLNVPFIGADVWIGALHGRKSTSLWTLRTSDVESHYAYNSLGMHPDILSEIGKRSLDVVRLSEEVQALSNRNYDAAIIYSDSSRSYRREYINAVYNAYCALRYSGKKVKFVTENQIKNDTDNLKNYQLVIVPSMQHATDLTVQAISEYCQNNGNLMIFDSQSLMYNEYGYSSKDRVLIVEDIHNAINTTVSDISFENYKMVEDVSQEIYDAALEQFGDTYLISDLNGNRVNVAYDITSHNGYTLINMYNTTSENINVTVSESGVNIENMYDLLNDEKITDGVTKLEPYGVALLKIERDPVEIIGNLSEKTMRIKGYAHTPNTLVSVLVTKPDSKESKVPFIGDIVYMNEKKCNNTGDFSFNVIFDEVMDGKYQIYVRLRDEENKISETYQYDFFVPKISVMRGDKLITDIGELSEGDIININLNIKNEDKRDFKGVLYCAQYENNILKDVCDYAIDSDKTQNQLVVKNYTIGKMSENSTFKIMFWECESITPFVLAYVID